MNNLTALRDDLRRFASERDWDQFHSPRNLTPEQSLAVRKEMADVLIYLVRLADKLDMELLEAASEKIVENARKYPADKARGSMRKYTEL